MNGDDRTETREGEDVEEWADERDDGAADEWDDDSVDRSDPFGELDVGGENESLDDAFDRMEVDELSDEELWTALDLDSAIGGDPPTDEPAGEEHVVEKREYCQRCPHFSTPPETACTHEDGTILEVIETDEFRVRGCPMVSEAGPRFDTGR